MDRRKYIENPYRPGAGHAPPFLAGRSGELEHLRRLLRQNFTTENVLVTGLRGMGKTALLGHMRQIAEQEGWICIGNDLSESSSLSEERLAIRILTDVSEALARIMAAQTPASNGCDNAPTKFQQDDAEGAGTPVAFDALQNMYERAPGLPSDRLRSVLTRLSSRVIQGQAKGLLFAYDEAQCLSDHAERDEFPMSLLVETIAGIQKKCGVAQCLLILSGLPQVFDALIDTRTYTERMFHVMRLERLSREDTFDAVATPLQRLTPPLYVSADLLEKCVELTGGYPYLIQFFGKELVDQLLRNGGVLGIEAFPCASVMERLDAGLFSARWNKTTDKQREVLKLIAGRDANGAPDFSSQEIAASSQGVDEVSSAQVNSVMQALCERGLLYRARHGRYAFTVPMSETMILRRCLPATHVEDSWRAVAGPAPDDKVEMQKRPVSLSSAASEAEHSRRWRWFR